MKLPLPADKLAGCVWLPRILAKARLLESGALAPEYAERFGHPGGVDGLFLVHFGLGRDDVLLAAGLPDEAVADLFLARCSAEKIAAWNELAMNLGRAGYPLAERLPVALATTYKELDARGLETVFEVIARDEG